MWYHNALGHVNTPYKHWGNIQWAMSAPTSSHPMYLVTAKGLNKTSVEQGGAGLCLAWPVPIHHALRLYLRLLRLQDLRTTLCDVSVSCSSTPVISELDILGGYIGPTKTDEPSLWKVCSTRGYGVGNLQQRDVAQGLHRARRSSTAIHDTGTSPKNKKRLWNSFCMP